MVRQEQQRNSAFHANQSMRSSKESENHRQTVWGVVADEEKFEVRWERNPPIYQTQTYKACHPTPTPLNQRNQLLRIQLQLHRSQLSSINRLRIRLRLPLRLPLPLPLPHPPLLRFSILCLPLIFIIVPLLISAVVLLLSRRKYFVLHTLLILVILLLDAVTIPSEFTIRRIIN